MTRSAKYPVVRGSKKYPDNIHGIVRKKAKNAIINFDDDFDNFDLGVNPHNSGFEEMGTKFGFHTADILTDDCFKRARLEFARK